MKTINVTFTDEEHETLMAAKGSLNWHDFILMNDDLKSLIRFYHDFVRGDPAWDDNEDEILKANDVYDVWKYVFEIEDDEDGDN